MPAAAVIPAPIAYIKVVVVKKLVVEPWARPTGPPHRVHWFGRAFTSAEPHLLHWGCRGNKERGGWGGGGEEKEREKRGGGGGRRKTRKRERGEKVFVGGWWWWWWLVGGLICLLLIRRIPYFSPVLAEVLRGGGEGVCFFWAAREGGGRGLLCGGAGVFCEPRGGESRDLFFFRGGGGVVGAALFFTPPVALID